MKHIGRQRFLAGLALALAGLAGTSQAQVANGSFETGNLTGWTTGGTGRVAVLQNSNIRVGSAAAPMPAVPDGSRFVAISTGPGTLTSSGSQIDGNSTNDFDSAQLNGSLSFSGRPAMLIFDWNFASSEANASPPYDDFFDVRINNIVVFSGSVFNSTANTSNYADVPVTGRGTVNWSVNLGVLNTVQMTQGVGAWRRACVPIAAATTGNYTLPISFRVGDQGDGTVDSTLLLDNVRVQASCDPGLGASVEQLSVTSGAMVERKGAGFVFTPVDQRLAVSNRNGGTYHVVVSSANLSGNAPGGFEQVFLRSGTTYTRIGPVMTAAGRVQDVAISDDGAWIAIAARPGATGNTEIYRVQRSNGTSVQITSTSAASCENGNPAISDGASPILAFESTCNALTGQGGTRKVVYRSGTAATNYVIPAGNCLSRSPTVTGAGRFIGVESTCNPPGRSNGTFNNELFVFRTNGNSIGTSSRWRQVTVTTAGNHFSLGLADTGDDFEDVEGVFVSDASLVGSGNNDGSTEVFRWVGHSTTANNGTLTQVTDNPITGKFYTQVRLAGSSDYFSFERIDFSSEAMDVGVGLSTINGGNLTPLVAGDAFFGLGVAETATEVLVPFIGTGNINSQNADGNYELFLGRVSK